MNRAAKFASTAISREAPPWTRLTPHSDALRLCRSMLHSRRDQQFSPSERGAIKRAFGSAISKLSLFCEVKRPPGPESSRRARRLGGLGVCTIGGAHSIAEHDNVPGDHLRRRRIIASLAGGFLRASCGQIQTR